MKVYKGDKRKEFFYLILNYTSNDEMKHHVCIYEKGKYEVHTFSKFFTSKIGSFSLKNKSYNTLKNFYLTFIIRFLNYIFNDAKSPINSIEDLTMDMVEEFLDKFAQSKLPSETLNRPKSEETVARANYAISHFVYWLWKNKIPSTSKKMFKMKNFNKDDFEFYSVNKKTKHGTVENLVLADIVVPNTSKRKYTRTKAMGASKYSISKLIEISRNKDPMITFAIVLGAYAGLRLGDICQMYEGRIKNLKQGEVFGAYFDFTYDTVLRSDNKMTSYCKTKRLIPIHEGCASAIYDYYNEHIEYLKHEKLYPNKYGALFLDKNGNAMTSRTIQRRFNTIEKLYEVVLKKEESMGNIDAKKETHLLKNADITIQSLRVYYKQLIETIENGNARKIQYYMTHKQVETQGSYGIAKATEDKIRKCQNEIYRPIKLGE